MSNWIINYHPSNENNDFDNWSIIRSDKIAIASGTGNDLLQIMFILCHEGVNLNYDQFLKEELEKSYATIVNKPINWEHNSKENIGVVTESYLLDPSNLDDYLKKVKELGAEDLVIGETKAFVLCKGVIWQKQNPKRALAMLDAHQDGTLFFSMENAFKEAECSVCHSRFNSYPYCDHLSNRRKTGKAARIFRDFYFTASGKVTIPGDPEARAISFATKVDTESFLNELKLNGLDPTKEDLNRFHFYVENNLYLTDECPCNSFADYQAEESVTDKMLWLLVCKDKNSGLYNEALSKLTGDTMANDKTYSQVELEAAIAKAIEDFQKTSQASKDIESYKIKVQELETAVASLTKEKEKFEKDLSAANTTITEMKETARKNDEYTARITELEKDSVPYDKEKIKDLIFGVSDASFKNIKDSLTFAASYKKEEKKEEKKEMKDEKKEKKEDKAKASQEQHEELNEKENEKENEAKATKEDELRSAVTAIFTKSGFKI